MGLPDIVIEFAKKAVTAIQAGEGGVVGIIVKDTPKGAYVLRAGDKLPELTEDNKAYVERAFLGAPKKVHLYVLPTEATDYSAAFKYFATKRVNYLCGDPAITKELTTALITWVKAKRKAGKIHPVAVLAGDDAKADDPGVVNFGLVGGENLNVGEKTFTAPQYCSRIAGLLAGLSYNVSATYKPLSEVTAIPEVDEESAVDDAIDAGKLVLYDNGTGIVIGRGVNSLTTVTQEQTEDLKKIKIVAIQDQITTDIMDTINKSYIGNYPNSYDNKCLLITAIKGYLKQLEDKGWIEKGKSIMEINVEKQKAYLESVGVDTTDMDEQAIKEANTGSKVFLKGSVSILDAIEDVDIVINKE